MVPPQICADFFRMETIHGQATVVHPFAIRNRVGGARALPQCGPERRQMSSFKS